MSSGTEDHHSVSDRARPARLKLTPSEVCTARTAVRTKKKKSNEVRGGIRSCGDELCENRFHMRASDTE